MFEAKLDRNSKARLLLFDCRESLPVLLLDILHHFGAHKIDSTALLEAWQTPIHPVVEGYQ